MLVSLLRTIILYFIIVFIIRLMGKRQLGELQPTELIITILISNIATLPLENVDTPLFMGLIPIMTLVILEVIISQINMYFPKCAKIFTGKSMVVIKDGKINQQKLKELRISPDDLLLQLRQEKIFDISQVELAIVETTGKLSVYEKYLYRNATPEDLKLQGDKKQDIPPIPLVINGAINSENLIVTQKTEKWVYDELKKRKTDIKEVYIMTVDSDNKCNIIKKA